MQMMLFRRRNSNNNDISLLGVLLLLLLSLSRVTLQQKTKSEDLIENALNADIPDDQLDPQDVEEFNKPETTTTTTTTNKPPESSTTTTIKTTTTTTIESTTTSTKIVEDEDTTTTTTTKKSTTTTIKTTTVSSTTTTTTSPDLDDGTEKDFEIKSTQYQEIVIDRSMSDMPRTVFYSVRSPIAALNNFQLQLEVVTESHLDFDSCAISFTLNPTTTTNPQVVVKRNGTTSQHEDEEGECLRSYDEIVDAARFRLRVKRHLLPNRVTLRLRPVVSGCDRDTHFRDLTLATLLPVIYHNSDHECIYRIVNANHRRSMMKVLIDGFPHEANKICHAIVELGNGETLEETRNGPEHRLQAKFDSFESIEPFGGGVMVAAKYAFIKVVNCYENNQPITIAIDAVRRSATVIPLNEKRISSRIDSDIVASPTQDTFLVAEIRNDNFRNLISYQLDYIVDPSRHKDCPKLDRNTSMLTIYGLDDLDQMHTFQYYPCTFKQQTPPETIDLNGFKTVYVQFYRETKNPALSVAADKFLLSVSLKLVQSKYIVLTDRARRVSSADFDSLYLRNFHLDFEIRAPLGHRIVLNVSRFDNGKKPNPQLAHVCDDYLMIRLNKTTNRMMSFYETSHNPRICSSLGSQPELASSYTNTLVVSIFLKQLGADDEELEFPTFEFSYTTEPFCNNYYTKRANSLISFSSLQSMPDGVDHEHLECRNTISVGRDRRVVLYKIDWLDYFSLIHSDADEIDLNFVNGRAECKGSDSLFVSDDNPKYSVRKSLLDDPTDLYNVYCMANPFRAYVSDSSRLHMIYKLHRKPSKPLVFDLGYFSYKYLYDQTDSPVDIDFSKIIPANVLERTIVSNLDVLIRLQNTSNYLVPVISQCDFRVDMGSIVLKTSTRSIPLNDLKCGGSAGGGENGEEASSYTTMLSMESELRVELRNVRLRELRDKAIRFRIDYKTQPRVFSAPSGTFETNNFKHDYVSITRDRVEYEWVIRASVNEMVRLRVNELANDAGITEWTITDLNENVRLYEQNELVENFKGRPELTYLIASDWIRITFKHERDGNKRRSTSTYPYLRASYTLEPRVLNHEDLVEKPSPRQEEFVRHELRLAKSLIKKRVDWLIVAPRDYHIVAEIARFEPANKDSNGQLKFSLLGRGYTDNGTYHFNLNDRQDMETRARVTDVVVSESSSLRVEYLPGQAGDSFTLAYRLRRRVLVEPAGWLRQYFNEMTKPAIFVPRLTDQKWTIRAPYTKRVALYTKFLDLLNETPCSKSSVNFYEANGTRLFSECGNLEVATFGLQQSLALMTESNELDIHFLTQNTIDVVYTGGETSSTSSSSDDSSTLDRSSSSDGGGVHTYRGFLFYYSFVESPGDCYFQQRGKNFMCGYESIGGPSWVVVGESEPSAGPPALEMTSPEQIEFEKTFCTNCYLSVQLPIQSESDPAAQMSILVSPVIDKSMLALKFDYRMRTPANLLVILIHDHDYAEKKFDRSVLIKKIDRVTVGNAWQTVRLKLGAHLLHNYRIMFNLERVPIVQGSQQQQPQQLPSPAVNLDNIQLFESDYECAVRIDDDMSCARSSDFESLVGIKSAANSLAFCQRYSTPCDLGLCQNGALCLNKNHVETHLLARRMADDEDFSCVCAFGFTGKRCEKRIDPCESNECSANSRCVSVLGESAEPLGYRCKCNETYFGTFCENKLSACKRAKNPCNEKTEQGKCIDVAPDTARCECSPLYTGANCELLLNERCLNSNCNKFDRDATCIELTDRFVCRCSPGFEGPSCTNIDDCKDTPCKNNGTCVDGIQSFRCECPRDFEGKYCEVSKKCSRCDRHGTLSCDPRESRCVCRATHGGELCEVELDPCLDKPCGEHGECVSDKIEKFECVCEPGFKGVRCERKENVCDLGLCMNGATCMLEQDMSSSHVMDVDESTATSNTTDNIGYVCECPVGFTGKHCELIDNMCASDPCLNGATCLPTPAGNFTCLCPVSHSGRVCEQKIDTCLTAKCAHGSVCHPRLNSYICECPPGKFGRYCDEEQDGCLNNECKNGLCVAHGLQSDGTHSYTCQCLPGYTGEHCEVEIDDCESSPCMNNATCLDLVGTYECVCPYNYRGKNCQDRVELCSLPETRCDLTNTRQCIPIPNGVKCDCLPRFTGLKCETPVSFCEAFSPCRSGVCVPLGGEKSDDYECRNCTEGYGGKNCSELIDYCKELSPCKNGGVCFAKPKDYFCQCPETFQGKNCELPVHPECIRNRCMNHSVCIPDPLAGGSRGYRCECDEDHEGVYCEKLVDKCRDVSCAESGGYCVNGKCECDPKNPMCESECKKRNVVCQNGGKCVDVIKGKGIEAVCMCPAGLTGQFCEHSMFCAETRMRPCGPAHQCKTANQSYECNCDQPFIGHGCSAKLHDYWPEYESYMTQVRLSVQNERCRFGRSKESKILIGIIIVGGLVLLIIGLMIGHCSIIAYRKRYEAASSLNKNKIVPYSALSSENSSQRSGYIPKTPVRALTPREINLNKSSAFSIPRPSVRL